ncbi:hypothetical protein Tco_0680848 [Tanacetum coccineum]|uniref:Uncharacterized protein n=1 Tax=Tanacetum coccineum TaxID=301880 RepID=A0ABQ4XLX7_9ASTR
MRIDPNMSQKEETYQVVVDIIKNTTFYKAFIASANVPEICMHQFWHTVTKVKVSTFYEFKLANKKCLVDLEVFCQALDIFLKVPRKELIIDNRQLKKSRREIMPYPRFTKIIINHFLSIHKSVPKALPSGLHTIKDDRVQSRMKFVRIGEDVQEYGRTIPHAMLTDDIKQSETYQMFIKYFTGLIHLKKTRGKGSQDKKADVIQKPASVEVSNESDSEPARKQTGNRRVIKKKVSISAEENIILEPYVVLELGKSMSLTEAAKEGATRKVHATHEQIKISPDRSEKLKGNQSMNVEEQLAADTMRALKATRKSSKSQSLTGGLSKGTGVSLGVLDESIVIPITSSEVTDTKPRVPDEAKEIDLVYFDEEEEKKDDDDDDDEEKTINIEETDDEETDDEFVQDDEYVQDDVNKEMEDAEVANCWDSRFDETK